MPEPTIVLAIVSAAVRELLCQHRASSSRRETIVGRRGAGWSPGTADGRRGARQLIWANQHLV